ncbi:MAG: hypothetical protein ACLSAP_09530 [Oscillospiraceae bacterium]
MFSCRIMNLGVEQWVFAHLGYPTLEIVGDVIAKVSPGQPKPSYITLAETSSRIQSEKLADFIDDSDKLKTLLISTCDLETITKYLKKSNNLIKHERNFQYGGTTIINSGSQYIRNCFCLHDEKKREINEHIVGYGHPSSFHTDIFSDTYSYVVLSFQYDVILRHLIDRKDPGICIPDGGSFYKNSGDDSERAARERYIAENYETVPHIPPERFYDNVVWIREKMPRDTILFLLAIRRWTPMRTTSLPVQRPDPSAQPGDLPDRRSISGKRGGSPARQDHNPAGAVDRRILPLEF